MKTLYKRLFWVAVLLWASLSLNAYDLPGGSAYQSYYDNGFQFAYLINTGKNFVVYKGGDPTAGGSYINAIVNIPRYAMHGREVWGISDYAFYDCPGVSTVTMEDCVHFIGRFAFRKCTNLTSITISPNLDSLCAYAFQQCSSLPQIDLTSNVRYLEMYTFSDCSSLSQIILPKNLQEIKGGAFYNCSSLGSINIPKTVSSIGFSAFCNCSSLTSVKLPPSIPAIESSTFSGCTSLQKIVIPETVTRIEYDAFKSCNALDSIYYGGTEEDWQNIMVGNNNTALQNAAIVYEFSTYELGDVFEKNRVYYKIVDMVDPTVLVVGTTNPSAIDSIVMYPAFRHKKIDYKVRGVASNVFSNHPNLTTILFSGTRTQWNKLIVENGNESLFRANIVYNYNAPVTELDTLNSDYLYIDRQTIQSGVDTIIEVKLKNQRVVTGLQFELALPAGVSVLGTPGNYQVELCSQRATSQTHNIFSFTKLQNGRFLCICSSTANNVIQGNDGAIVRIRVHFADTLFNGIYPIVLRNIAISDAAANVKRISTASYEMEVIRVDFSALIEKLSEATAYYDMVSVGYPTLVTSLQQAIASAQAIVESTHVSQDEIDASVISLSTILENTRVEIASAESTAANLAAFNAYKNEHLALMDTLHKDDDSELVVSLITQGKDSIAAVDYNESISLAENIAQIEQIYSRFSATILRQQYEDHLYVITFCLRDGTVLQQDTLYKGTVPVFRDGVPVKEKTAKYSYVFKRWFPSVLSPVTQNRTYIAEFDSIVNRYLVTFLDEDGTILEQDSVEYYDYPQYKGTTPTKEPTAQHTFSFKGWTPAKDRVLGDATYQAEYDSHKRQYTITYMNNDRVWLRSSFYYGEMPYYKNHDIIHPKLDSIDARKYVASFTGWYPPLDTVRCDTTYTATYEISKRKYSIQFCREDGKSLLFQELEYGDMPQYTLESPPWKASSDQYDYTFSGWDPPIDSVTGDATYLPVYTQSLRKYEVEFLDRNNNILYVDTVEYGSTPEFPGTVPNIETSSTTYIFAGWNNEFVPVTSTANCTYKANYNVVPHRYVITFQNDDGTILLRDTVLHGKKPEYKGQTPTKDSDVQYHYSFIGWSPQIVYATSDTVYTATYNNYLNSYEIIFRDGEGGIHKRYRGAYGTFPESPTSAPIKNRTARYSYVFTGWTPALDTIRGSATYIPLYDSIINKYNVCFLNGDGSILQSDSIEYGTLPVAPTPVQESTAQYSYTFKEWLPKLTEVTGNVTYRPLFNNIPREYTVTFLDYDGTVIQVDTVEYCTFCYLPYHGQSPQRENTAQYTYNFIGWYPAFEMKVTGDATFYAQYDSVVNKYVVRFETENGSLLQSDILEYGTMPIYRGTIPTKENTAEHTYFFGGWSPTIEPVTQNVTYTATYTETETKYVVGFEDADGTQLQMDSLAYGTTPTFRGTLPSKATTAQYIYTFAGWSPTITPVYDDITYTAVYDSIKVRYSILGGYSGGDGQISFETTSYAWGEEVRVIVSPNDECQDLTYLSVRDNNYVEIPVADNKFIMPASNVTYTAFFSRKNVTFTFVDYDGRQLQSSVVSCGSTPNAPANPSRPKTAQYTYTFSGWQPALYPASCDTTFVATYDSIVNNCVVVFQNEDGVILQQESVEYGTLPIYRGATPMKQNTSEYSYYFIGWSPAIVPVTQNVTYTATYREIRNKFAVQFVDGNGNILQADSLYYGAAPLYHGALPTKESNALYSYSFAGWSPELSIVAENVTYTAMFDSTKTTYMIAGGYDGGNGYILFDATQYAWGEEVQIHVHPYDDCQELTKLKIRTTDNVEVSVTDNKFIMPTSNVNYEVNFSTKKYHITYVDYDGSYYWGYDVDCGMIPSAPGRPSRPSTSQYAYTFSGWQPALTEATDDAIYTATYDSTKIAYTINNWSSGPGYTNVNGVSFVWGEEVEIMIVPNDSCSRLVSLHVQSNNQEIPVTDNRFIMPTGNVIIYSEFSTKEYTITYVDYNDTPIQNYTVQCGNMPTTPPNPFRQSTAQYTYTFSGWQPAVSPALQDAVYKAVYDSIVNTYVVLFKDENGRILQSETLEYGTVPVYHGEMPTKESTVESTFFFSGWSPSIVPVTQNATYVAQYGVTGNKYVVMFLNEDGTLLQIDTLAYGALPEYRGATPSKASTAQYIYAFGGWNTAVVPVAGNATYMATFVSTTNKYVVTFQDEDGTLLQQGSVEYGLLPAYHGATPTKQSTAEYTYFFGGWMPTVAPVTENVTYTAAYDSIVNKYVVLFLNEDSTLLQIDTIAYGEMPEYRGIAPMKQSTAQYTYTFGGWNTAVVSVTSDATYLATFVSTTNKYVITFQDEGGTLLQQDSVEYGSLPAYRGAIPTKQSTAEHTYFFGGWTPTIVAVTQNAVYTAIYTETENKYVVLFQDEDGTILQRDTLAYGTLPAYRGTTPSKQSTAQFTYSFNGWSPTIEQVTGEAIYVATYASTVNKYIVLFQDEDGTILQRDTLDYGTLPAYRGTTPSKQPTAQYTYSFSGWSPTIELVTGEAVYVATYASTVNKYIVLFQDEDGMTLQRDTLDYGALPAFRGATPSKQSTAQFTYSFNGWSPTIEQVTGEAIYVATYSSTVNKYVVLFQDEDGTILQRDTLDYGTLPAYRGTTPSKQATAQFTYSFNGWSPTITEVAEDAVYTATYSETTNEYIIIFLNEDSTVLQQDTLAYGTMPEYRGEDPTKPNEDEYYFVFAGWDPEVVAVTSDATYIATYTSHVTSFDIVEGDKQPIKIFENGILYIIFPDGTRYSATGKKVE